MPRKKIFLGIPVLNRIDLLERCLEHVDHPAEIVVVNNNWHDPTFNAALTALAERRRLEVWRPERNLGVARSWNLIVRLGMGRGYDRIFIGSNDTFLHPGALRTVLAAEPKENELIWHIHFWNFFALHVRAIRRVGWFDENFYPAYKEDQDFRYRYGLAGLRRIKGEELGVGADHLGSQTIFSDPEYLARNGETLRWNVPYYVAKWGGDAGAETFTSPFGRRDRDWRWWPHPDDSIWQRDWDRARRRRSQGAA
jgi:glycosyltransferase involved in cell wall biosynthesis